MNADLPPVGELVQITVQDADGMASGLGQLRPDGTRFDSLDWPPGIPVGLVTSWCRVLVLPDSDELRATLVLRLHREGWRPPCDGWSPEDTTANGEAAWAALREAAIR